MTVPITTSRVEYAGNGTTTVFAVPFYFLANADLKVYKAGVLQTLTTHYSVSGAGTASGSVTFVTAPAGTEDVVIFRDPAITQTTDYQPNDPFPAETHERALDKLTMIAQRIRDLVSRSFVLPDGDTSGASTVLPSPQASRVIGWNEAANALVNYAPADLATVVVTGTSYCDVFDGDGTTVAFTLTANPGSINALDVAISGVSQVNGIDFSVSGTTITFADPPPSGTDNIAVRYVAAVPIGSANAQDVTFLQAGTGAVSRTVQAKLRDTVSVKDFGAVGDGVADDTAAIQAACTAAKTVTFGSSADNYRVTGTITLTSGTTLLMQGATITQATDQTPIFNASSTDNVTITGGRFVGKSEASYTNSPASQAICIKANNATDLLVTGNRFENFWYSPLMIDVGGNRVEFSSNSVKGPGSSVLGVDTNRRNTTGCTITGNNLRIVNNDIYDTAQGVIVGQGSSNIVVDGNVIHDLINEHGIYADTGLRLLTISNNVIRNTGVFGAGLKVQCYDSFGVQTQNVTITANVIDTTGGDGILIDNTTTNPTLLTLGVVISNNAVLNAGAYGIDVRDGEDCIVSSNVVINPVQSGIAWDDCLKIVVVDNHIRGSATSGIRDLAGQSNTVHIKNNLIVNCATANTVGDEYGIFLNSGAPESVIDGNVILDSGAKMQYGVYVVPNFNSTLSIINNTVVNSTDAALRLGSTAALREYRGNSWAGTLAATFNDPVLPSVASAATITLPTAHDVVSITGTTGITGINANGHSGRIVTLVFTGALTVTRGGVLLLNQSAGNFTTTANDTLTLACDGTNWYEISRSAN